MSLEDLDISGKGSKNDSGELDNEREHTETPGPRVELTTATVVGNPVAVTPVTPLTPPAAEEPPRMPKKARSRAGQEGGEHPKSTLSSEDYKAIVDEATREAGKLATRQILEDENFARHLIIKVHEKVLETMKAAKAPETERTPTMAAPVPAIAVTATNAETTVANDVVEDVTEVDPNETTEVLSTEKKDVEAPGFFATWGTLIAVLLCIAFIIGLAFYTWPDTSDRRVRTATTRTTETANTDSVNAARPIASGTRASEEEVNAFAARVPYSLSERLIGLRQLRNSDASDARDMDCSGTGMNFSTRAFIERSTPTGIDRRNLTPSEAQTYFADPGHTGQHMINSIDGPRYYTVYLDLRDREGETGHCNFFVE